VFVRAKKKIIGGLRWERRYTLNIRGKSMFLSGAGDHEDQNQGV
jgi:hypothetical protein